MIKADLEPFDMQATINSPQKPDGSSYLSVVAASRNDDHGGDPLIRTQIFINNFARQCEKYRLPAELLIVDWNPVPDRPGLAAVLSIPPDTTLCKAKVITVPAVLHRRLKYADKFPFFQMIAKNVGIRRAKGQFILATNIDILFSDELMEFIAFKELNSGKLYRVDRYDIRSGLSPESALDEVLDYAWNNPIRAHRRYHPEKLVEHLYGSELFKRNCVPSVEFRKKIEGVSVVQEHDVWQVRPERAANMDYLHTNACGDFTLLPREGWDAIRGYPEFEAFSFNIDSVGLVAAHYAGYEEVSLLPPCVCFHIEHGLGSGWTPEGEKKLFNRLRVAGILNPEWPVLMPLVDEMRARGRSLEFNHAGWGMAGFDLPEQAMGDADVIPAGKLARLALQAETREMSAIQPAYDLDRLTLAYERGVAELTVAARAERVVLYIPGSDGNYRETRSIGYRADLTKTTTVIFRLEKFARQFPLRFDPCQCPGLISINSLTAFDTLNNKVVWELDGCDANKLVINGTAAWAHTALARANGVRKMFFSKKSNGRQPLRLVSTGSDPQLILPTLPRSVGFPLVISVEMNIILSD
jgi:hypothetical protein